MRTNKVQEALSTVKADRRVLPHVPDPFKIRGSKDRRSTFSDHYKPVHGKDIGKRYAAAFPVSVRIQGGTVHAQSVDVSQNGILLKAESREAYDRLVSSARARLSFTIPAGAMEEGLEGKRMRIRAAQSRATPEQNAVAFAFENPLGHYLSSRETTFGAIAFAAMMLISAAVLLMRAESLFYLRFNRITAVYSLATGIYLLTRYLFGSFYRPVAVDPAYTPGVSIIIPCYNEEEWIDRTITSALDQDYPSDQLEVIIVDDASTDASLAAIQRTLDRLTADNDRFGVKSRVKLLKQPKNAGKRHAMAWGVKEAAHDLVVFVDSDSFLEPDAIRNLVQPFKDGKTAGVSGRTDVANTFTNALTRMQSVRYYIAFRVTKAAESIFDGVTCLSGPLSCYRKSVMMNYLDDWLNQSFLGQKATFGDDRSMTNFMLRKHRTSYQHTAVAYTIVPSTYKIFLRQQMRWKRSWLRESFIAASFVWKKEPFMALSFYFGMIITILSPGIVVYNLLVVPLTYHQVPVVFLIGLLLMAMMMSAAQLFLRRSTTWLYGILFNLFYVFVLIWQMPIAWVTFWRSNWGTR
ncbi:MAG: glycosyltransferase [Clostridiales bacterium]|nr:glycosyltransferase [Clostridiales bacterium]